MGFRIDRRWATLAVAVVLGVSGGTLLGFVTAPAPGEDLEALAPVPEVAPSTTLRQRSRFAGTSSTTTRPRVLPAATAGRGPASSTARPTTTTVAPTTSTTVTPSTTTTSTTVGDTTTTSSSSTVPSSTTTSTS